MKLFFIFGIVLSMFVGGFTANAQNSFGYCSGYNATGNWSFYHGQVNAQVSCQLVQSYLYSRGGAPIAWNSGYYNGVGFNRVNLSCSRGAYQREYYGAGRSPLISAFNQARASGLPFCLISVY